MVKSYLKYVSDGSFGVVSSYLGNIVAHPNGKQVIVPALENIHIWDLKQGTLVETWRDEDMKETVEVTCISKPSQNGMVAIGYSDGSVRIWNNKSSPSTYMLTFHGHQSAITCLQFDKDGHRLVSGSKDTDIVVWDILSESGMYRFKGHKDQVTGLIFLESNGLNHIVSVSKDTLLKIWDLSTQFCVETLVAHRSEVWSLDIHPLELVLMTTASDDEIRFWNIDVNTLKTQLSTFDHRKKDYEKQIEETEEDLRIQSSITQRGSLKRTSKERSIMSLFHPQGEFFAVQSADRSIEIFKMLSSEEIKKKQARRRKRQRERTLKAANTAANEENDSNMENVVEEKQEEVWSFQDEINQITIIRASVKVRSFDFVSGKTRDNAGFGIVCGLTNNTIEHYQVSPTNKEEHYQLKMSLERQGHRSDIRCLALSEGDDLIVTGSSNAIKLWNLKTRNCIKTMESGYCLSIAFVPGYKHVLVGTKTGEVEIYDLASSSLLESVKAHEGPVWSIEVRPDRCGFTSGSADKQVKFWDFQLVEDTEYSTITKRLTITHTRTLKMSDDVLCLRHSHDGRLIAISLLDSTVKVFYHDSLKFVLSLYGHKLPVLSMDISSDGTLIATGSADKTIKIWGLDFGDCHRSLLAHNDSVMNIKFVWGTHYMFSVSKDKTLKYWDLDKFEQIMNLQGHHGEVWALGVGKYGNVIVTGSHDRSIRIFNKTDEQLFIEEEREKEMEEMFEQQALQGEKKYNKPIGSGVDESDQIDGVPINNQNEENEVAAPTKKTSESLTWGEKITEAIEVWQSEMKAQNEYEQVLKVNPDAAPPARNPYILASNDPKMSAEAYVLREMEKIPVSYLDESLLTLPFNDVSNLLTCLKDWIGKGWNINLSTRILHFILRIHYQQITATKSFNAVTLIEIQKNLKPRVKEHQKTIGFNLAAMKFLKREVDARNQVGFDDDSQSDPNSLQNTDQPFDLKKGGEKRKRQIVS